MPITLAKIASNTATVSFAYGTDSVNIVYYPGRVTEKSIAVLNSFDNMDAKGLAEGFATFNETLAHLIKSWDVFDDMEQTIMFPLDPARLAELPVAFRVQVLSVILGDIRPEMIAPPPIQS